MWKNVPLVTSSATQEDAFWLSEDVMARLIVMMAVMKKTAAAKIEIFGNVQLINNV